MVPTGDGHGVLHFTASSPGPALRLQKNIKPVLTDTSTLEEEEEGVGDPGMHSLVGV